MALVSIVLAVKELISTSDLARYLVGRRPTTTPGEVSSSDDDDPGESSSDDDDDDDENDDEGDDQYTEYLIISNTTLELTSDIVPQTRKSSMTTTPVSDDGNTQDASDAGVEGDVRVNGTADNAGVEGVEVDFRISGTGGKQLGITARNNSDTDDSRNVTTKVDEPIVFHATTQTVVAAIGENTNFLLMGKFSTFTKSDKSDKLSSFLFYTVTRTFL
jgi:hypothetical protein